MRVALIQSQGRGQDPGANLDLLARHARDAAARGARVLVTPEMFLCGYNIPPGAVHAHARDRGAGALAPIAGIARDNGLALVVGYPERDGEHVYNSAVLVDRDGRECLNYRKSHLFGQVDRGAFTAGDGTLALARLDAFTVGMLICYDVEFPENVRALALAGADLVIVPTALMEPYAFVSLHMVPTRAFENQLFMLYSNRCGVEGQLHYPGLSCAVGPDGSDLARAGAGEEVLVADLDHDAIGRSRAINTYFADRRPALYRSLVPDG